MNAEGGAVGLRPISATELYIRFPVLVVGATGASNGQVTDLIASAARGPDGLEAATAGSRLHDRNTPRRAD